MYNMVMWFNLVPHILKRTGKRKSEKVNFCNVTTEVIFSDNFSRMHNMVMCFNLVTHILKRTGKRKSEKSIFAM